MRIPEIRYKCDKCGEVVSECVRFYTVSVKDDVETEWKQPFTGLDLCMTCALKAMNALNDKPEKAEEVKPKKKNYLTNNETIDAENMFREGYSIEEIAKRLNSYSSTVKRELSKIGLLNEEPEEPEKDIY